MLWCIHQNELQALLKYQEHLQEVQDVLVCFVRACSGGMVYSRRGDSMEY
jgi:hypothetical protein